jgi:hypothetical protein
VNWFPQFNRDLNKYQEGQGILLLPVPEVQEPYLASGYWNSVKLLSHKYFDEPFDIPTRLLESTNLSLRYDFEANISESFKFTAQTPAIREDDYEVPRYQKNYQSFPYFILFTGNSSKLLSVQIVLSNLQKWMTKIIN